MKVYQLKKIMEVVREENIEIYDYETFLSLSKEDVNYLIQKIDENNKKVKQLFKLLIHIHNCENWEDRFSHLEGVENFNLKEYILDRIANSASRKHAEAIYHYYNLQPSFEWRSKLSILKSIEEWKTYIESINPNIFMFNNDEKALNNLEFTLQNNSEEDRCDLIKKVMQYSQSENSDVLELSEYSNILEQMPDKMSELLDLLLKGYDFHKISQLLIFWTNRHNYAERNNEDVEEIDTIYQELINYLKTSIAMTDLNLKHFINMLTYMNYRYYSEYVKLLKEIEDKEDWKLLGICIYDQVFLGNSCIRNYLEMILSTSDMYRDELFSRRDALTNLLKNSPITLFIPFDTYRDDGWPEKMPVLEFLDNYNIDNKVSENYDTEKIIEDFSDEDEVTPKILNHFLVKKYK